MGFIEKLCCLILVCSSFLLYAHKPDLRFYNYTNSNGLVDNATNAVIQDDSGLIWIATDSGLDRFDGNSFKHYTHSPHDPHSVGENVECFFVDSDKELWLGSATGLQKYNYSNDNFETVIFTDSLQNEYRVSVVSLSQDKNYCIWAVTENKGIIKYNVYTEEFKIFAQDSRDVYSLPVNDFSASLLDGDSLWLATKSNGLLLFNIHSNEWEWVDVENDKGSKPLSDSIRCMCSDGDLLWLGSQNQGLFTLDKKTLRITYFNVDKSSEETCDMQCYGIHSLYLSGNYLYVGSACGLEIYDKNDTCFYSYRFDVKNEFSLPGSHVVDLVADKNKNIWMCTDQGGVSMIPYVTRGFKHEIIKREYNNFRQNFISSIFISENNNFWVGTDGAGLYLKTSESEEYMRMDKKIGIEEGSFLCIDEDEDSVLWMGSDDSGLFAYDQKTGSVKLFSNSESNPNSLKSNLINDVLADKDNNIWVATNAGLHLWQRGTENFKHFEMEAQSSSKLGSECLYVLFQDSRGNVWVGSFSGLSLIDPVTFKVKTFYTDTANSKSISSNVVYSLTEDRFGQIWIGTKNGLNMFNYADSTFISYADKNDRANNIIHSVLVGENDDVWMATNFGVSRFKRSEGQFYNYDDYDGLQGAKFKRAGYKNGEMLYFGGVNGINYFSVNDIEDNHILPEVYITNLKVQNEEVEPSVNGVLKKNILYANGIELEYEQNMVEIEFSAMDLVNPNKVLYKYKLEGFDRNWNVTSSQKRSVNYSNLSPGRYLFKVKASNSDHVWGRNQKEFFITVNPPFWKRVPFYFGISTFIIIGLYFIIRFRERRLFSDKVKLEELVQKRTREIEQMNEEMQLQNQELKELNSTKDRFFSIIAHDLKNPMNALLGFSQVLYDRYATLPDEKRKKMVRLLNESSMHMFDLLNNLLDWSRSQTGSIKFNPYSCSPARMIKDNVALVRQLAKNKDIDISTEIYSPKSVFADSNMLNTVVRNILTNSIKFTPRGGSIFIEVDDEDSEYIAISIKDTGIGMSEEQIDSLFKIDSHHSTSGTENENGTGLGLIVCKEFVERNGGHLRVSSKHGIGTVFSFTVPVFK